MSCLRTVIVFVSIVIAANAAANPVKVNNFQIILFGRVWNVDSYFVQDDLQASLDDFTFFEPRGLAYKNSMLFASGDLGQYESDSRVAVYSYANGALAFNHFVQMPDTWPNWWGPNGLTFNNSGTGYGSGSNQIVTVEDYDANQAGIVDLSSGAVSSKLALSGIEDITFLGGAKQFAVLSDGTGSNIVKFYNQSMVSTGASFHVVSASAGLVGLSASYGSWLVGAAQSQEIFLVVSSANTMLAYDLSGNKIGAQQNLPALPKARIPMGGGFYDLKPAFGSIEAITADESTKTIFLGDSANTMIHVLTPVRLGADLNSDRAVNNVDFSQFASQWLYTNCQLPGWCNGADLDHNGKVDFSDLSAFIQEWLAQGI